MHTERKPLLQRWSELRSAVPVLYATGDRQGWETQIHPEVLDRFVHHLDLIGQVDCISLILYTRGGSTLAGWSLVNLIRQFCSRLEVIVPSKAHSSGTIICLGADQIMMTKQATLGPIDPSVNGPLNPEIPGAAPNVRAPVSVEAINGFLGFAKEAAKLESEDTMKEVLLRLADRVHPLVLGEVHRSRSQIRMLARRLLAKQVSDEEKVGRILDFLCSESGSHDYTIYRQEARDELGLNILRPDDDHYTVLKAIYDDFAGEMQLGEPWGPELALAGANSVDYEMHRALIESVSGGSHVFMSKGQLFRRQVQTSQGVQMGVEDKRTLEGWIHNV